MSSWRSLRPQVALRSSQSAIFVLSPQSEIRNPQFSVDQDIRQSAIIRKAYSVGDVAQLGERRTRIAEVVGSTPIVSTRSSKEFVSRSSRGGRLCLSKIYRVFAHPFR